MTGQRVPVMTIGIEAKNEERLPRPELCRCALTSSTRHPGRKSRDP
jgi:hypothetical protein